MYCTTVSPKGHMEILPSASKPPRRLEGFEHEVKPLNPCADQLLSSPSLF